MHDLPNLVSVTSIKCDHGIGNTLCATGDSIACVGDHKGLVVCVGIGRFFGYVSQYKSRSGLKPLIPMFGRVGQDGRSIRAGVLACVPITGGAIGSIVVVWVLAVRYAPVRAAMKLAINLKDITLRNVRPGVIVTYNTPAPDHAGRSRLVIGVGIVVTLHLLGSTTLALGSMHR